MIFGAVLSVVVAFSIGFGFGDSAQADPSASGTSIPITKGGTGATTAAGALTNLLPDFGGNDGKVLGLSGGTPSWVAQTGGGNSAYMTPDYGSANTTTISSFPYNVAELGYVYLRIYVVGAGVDVGTVLINGQVVLNPSSNGVTFVDTNAGVFPVVPGDVITIADTNNVKGNFIPPKYSTPPQPIVVEGGDYDTAERQVMVNDNGTQRPKLDVLGKPIYVKTVNLNGLNSGGKSVNTGLTAAAVKIIEFDGYAYNSSTSASIPLPYVHLTSTTALGGVMVYTTVSSGSLMITTYNSSDYSGFSEAYMTIYYTKTTDTGS